jgi:aspartate aminotransferase
MHCLKTKLRSDGSSYEIWCASKTKPAIPPLNKLQVKAFLIDTPQSGFDEAFQEYRERRDTLVTELNKIEGVVVIQ